MDIITIGKYAGLAGLVLWSINERAFRLLKQQQSETNIKEWGSYWTISAAWYGSTLYSLADGFRLMWTVIKTPPTGLLVAGMALVMVGLALRYAARRDLGRHYSVRVATWEMHKLVTKGVYKKVRHPAYLGLVCLFFGIPLCEGSWGGLILSVIFGISAIVFRIQIEERFLITRFGKAYEDYIERTWRLIPHIW